MLFDVVCACFKIEYFINTRAYDLHKKILVSSSILCATTSTKYSRSDFQQKREEEDPFKRKRKVLSSQNLLVYQSIPRANKS